MGAIFYSEGSSNINKIFLPEDIGNMSSIDCFESALKDSNIITINDVDDETKISKVDKSLFAAGLVKAMEENEYGRYLFYRAYLNKNVKK